RDVLPVDAELRQRSDVAVEDLGDLHAGLGEVHAGDVREADGRLRRSLELGGEHAKEEELLLEPLELDVADRHRLLDGGVERVESGGVELVLLRLLLKRELERPCRLFRGLRRLDDALHRLADEPEGLDGEAVKSVIEPAEAAEKSARSLQ